MPAKTPVTLTKDRFACPSLGDSPAPREYDFLVLETDPLVGTVSGTTLPGRSQTRTTGGARRSIASMHSPSVVAVKVRVYNVPSRAADVELLDGSQMPAGLPVKPATGHAPGAWPRRIGCRRVLASEDWVGIPVRYQISKCEVPKRGQKFLNRKDEDDAMG